MSQLFASSVRDLLPESCCLNIEDDDEGTLSLVTKFTDLYLAHSTIELENNSGSESDKNTDSDVSSESESEEVYF